MGLPTFDDIIEMLCYINAELNDLNHALYCSAKHVTSAGNNQLAQLIDILATNVDVLKVNWFRMHVVDNTVEKGNLTLLQRAMLQYQNLIDKSKDIKPIISPNVKDNIFDFEQALADISTGKIEED
jgi:hypothetical protein